MDSGSERLLIPQNAIWNRSIKMTETTIRLPFWKLQSVGNDFALVHITDLQDHLVPLGLTVNESLSRLARVACDRRFGIGSDGLLTVEMTEKGLVLRMFNPDGTEDFCGNGIRCAAHHVYEQEWMGSEFPVIHFGRTVDVRIENGLVATTIGCADYDPKKVPHKGKELFDRTVWSGMDSGMPVSLFGSALSTGTSHVVIPTIQLPEDDSFRSISSKIEVDPMFPERTSVIWSQEVEPMKLKLRIWERGVGETLGCGSGSSAAAADYLRRKGKGGRVSVLNPGGALIVSMDAWDKPITLQGIAYSIFKGIFPFQVEISEVIPTSSS